LILLGYFWGMVTRAKRPIPEELVVSIEKSRCSGWPGSSGSFCRARGPTSEGKPEYRDAIPAPRRLYMGEMKKTAADSSGLAGAFVPSVKASVQRQIAWLEAFWETSQDHEDFYVKKAGWWAKRQYYDHPLAGKFLVAPFVFLGAFLPSARSLFSPKRRLPISDAHYAMWFAYLHRLTGDR
jgi:hypothetical protein